MINLCHRTVLTGWVLLIDDERAFLRLVLALFTSLLVCFFLLALRPYRKTSDLMLAASQQLLSPAHASVVVIGAQVRDDGVEVPCKHNVAWSAAGIA